jgi:hypothetical protein
VTTEKKHRVVCCSPKVVLSGWATDEEMKKTSPTLTDVRMCVYWTSAVGGPMGLAAVGPDSGCRITKAAPTWTIPADKDGSSRVEGYGESSEAAVKAWESEPWG